MFTFFYLYVREIYNSFFKMMVEAFSLKINEMLGSVIDKAWK